MKSNFNPCRSLPRSYPTPSVMAAENKAFFAAAYPGDALDKLWWWPVQESWFVAKRNGYQDQFLSA